jgi:hypothetical protein
MPGEPCRTLAMAKSEQQQPGDEHLREIAEKVRDLARQTQSLEVREELFDLADRLDWMIDLGKKTPG